VAEGAAQRLVWIKFFHRCEGPWPRHLVRIAQPREGPSAGLAFVTGIVSALTGRPVKPACAMTGEVTLHGEITAVSGMPFKIKAAAKAGRKLILVPAENAPRPSPGARQRAGPGRGGAGQDDPGGPGARTGECSRLAAVRRTAREREGAPGGCNSVFSRNLLHSAAALAILLQSPRRPTSRKPSGKFGHASPESAPSRPASRNLPGGAHPSSRIRPPPPAAAQGDRGDAGVQRREHAGHHPGRRPGRLGGRGHPGGRRQHRPYRPGRTRVWD